MRARSSKDNWESLKKNRTIPVIHAFPLIGHFRRKDGFLVQKCLPVLAAFVAKMDSWLESAAPLRVSAGTGVRFSPVCRSKRVGMTTNHKGMTQAVIAKNEPRTHWFAANLASSLRLF